MSDRLADLRRQRALVIEQLTWLDREIQREASHPTSPAAPDSAAPDLAALSLAIGAPVRSDQTAQPATLTAKSTTPTGAAPFADYDVNPVSVRQDVKKGCLIYFAAAFGLIGALLVLAYFTLGKR